MTHICVSKLTIIGSDNGLSPGRHQAIIWTNAGILLIRTLGTNFSKILIGIQTFSFKKIHLKMSSATCRLLGLGLNVLTKRAEHDQNSHQIPNARVKCSPKIYPLLHRDLPHSVNLSHTQAEPWWRASIWRSHRKVVIKQCSYHNNIIDIQNRLPYSKVVYPAIIVLFSCLMEVNHGVRTGPDYPFR